MMHCEEQVIHSCRNIRFQFATLSCCRWGLIPSFLLELITKIELSEEVIKLLRLYGKAQGRWVHLLRLFSIPKFVVLFYLSFGCYFHFLIFVMVVEYWIIFCLHVENVEVKFWLSLMFISRYSLGYSLSTMILQKGLLLK